MLEQACYESSSQSLILIEKPICPLLRETCLLCGEWMPLRRSSMFCRVGTDMSVFNTHMRWCFHSDSSSGSHLSWQSPMVQPVPQRNSEKRRADRDRKRGTRQRHGEKAYEKSCVSSLQKLQVQNWLCVFNKGSTRESELRERKH